jgi:SAM-dependent methyltransferase
LRKFFRTLLEIYYRALFGRRFPGSEPLARWLRSVERRSGRGDLPLPRGAWEKQYRDGVWSYLDEAGELARYGVVAAAVRRFRPGGTVLDLGCGEGLLADHLRPDGYRRYLGIDLSLTAVAAAVRRAPGRAGAQADRDAAPATRFAVADAEDWPLRGVFDAVVLNECLYYLRDPLAVARRALAALRPGGILVVSMFRTGRTGGLARLLARELPLLEEVVLSSGRGAWIVGLYRRRTEG